MAYTQSDLTYHIKELGVQPTDTLLVHSSMKAIGDVVGGAEGVLDALMAYLKPGLLIFPTLTWRQINAEYNRYDPQNEPSCIGLLPNLFLKRSGVVRSWHPTHSVAAYGADAVAYTAGEEQWDTPCPRQGCWGKLIDRSAKILFLGCTLKSNTFLHGVEEWNQVPNRISQTHQDLKIRLPDGTFLDRPMRRHHAPGLSISAHYDKVEAAFLAAGIARRGRFGDAACTICDAVGMNNLTSSLLQNNPDMFSNDLPVDMKCLYR
ncbi:MAG: AAC(3) family N-acetyltransferase [Ruminococcaceae bacterium]|nr:AAC(3) family N-acetyltransferase [Oscillospiraceae bacterium]